MFPFEIDLPEDEDLISHNMLLVSKPPFTFTVSTKALYLPQKKAFALDNPWQFRRIPLSKVHHVTVERLKPYWLYLLSVLMILIGAYTSYWSIFEGEPWKGRGYPIALVVGGLVLPFIARGRFRLVVSMINETFKWKQPLVVDRKSRLQIRQFLLSVASASKEAGIHTYDEELQSG